ncbi:putative exodeoxyribonuclease VIII [Klebsiella variicola]|nr:putative exodeoxyribonuclease VIII [Klebsiella variicola]
MTDEDRPTSPYFQKRLSKLKVWEFCLTFMATELKSKAVKRYYLVDAKNKVEAAINSLPNPGDPEAEALFAKAESTLTSSRRHLGDELYDQFRITLDDMKPEYVG